MFKLKDEKINTAYYTRWPYWLKLIEIGIKISVSTFDYKDVTLQNWKKVNFLLISSIFPVYDLYVY